MPLSPPAIARAAEPWTPESAGDAISAMFLRLQDLAGEYAPEAECELIDLLSTRAVAALQFLRGKATAAEIGRRLGRSKCAVHRAMRVAQLGAGKRARFLDDESFEEIRRLNAQGRTDTEIARELGHERHEGGRCNNVNLYSISPTAQRSPPP